MPRQSDNVTELKDRVLRCLGAACVAANLAVPALAQQETSTDPADTSQAAAGQPVEGQQQPPEEATSSGELSDPPVVPTIPVGSETATAPPGEGEATQLDDIVVTANKRSELLSEIAGSVSAMSGDRLKKIGAMNFQDIATYLPGVSSASRGVGQNEIVIRGVAAGNEGQSVSSTVGVYLDELPIGSSTAYAFGVYAADINVFDLDRVELLSGPQGTLYGASSLGGLLKYVTAPPDLNLLSATLQGDASNTNNGGRNDNWRGMVNVPIRIASLDVPIGIRLDGFSEKGAGFIDDLSRGLENVDESKNEGGRGSILTNFTPDLSLRLSTMQQKITRGGPSTVDHDPHAYRPVQGQYDHSSHFDEPFLSKFRQHSGVLNWNPDWGSVASVSGWQKSELGFDTDATSSFSAAFMTGNTTQYRLFVGAHLEKFTQEVRVTTSGSLFDWQLGGFYTSEQASSRAQVTTYQATGSQNFLTVDLLTTYREDALFGNTTVHFGDQFDLGLGVRYARNEQVYRQFNGGVLGSAPADNSPKQTEDRVTTYLVNPSYRFADTLMVYGRVASGYRPGGKNYIPPPPQTTTTDTFLPDTVWNYELGSKMAVGSRASVTFDVFRIDWKDIQLLVSENNLNTLKNGNRARVLGSELSGSYLVASGLTVGGNMTYTKAALSEDAPDLEAHKGDRLPLSPRFGAALTTDYTLPLWDCCATNAGISYRYVGKRPSGFDGSSVHPQYWVPAYGMLDVRGGLQWRDLDLALALKNALNKQGGVSVDSTGITQDPNAVVPIAVTQPRTVGLTLTYYF